MQPAPRPAFHTILFWLGLAACGSTLLLATTNQISQDIAVVPFLWVAPLSIYLLTFILTFEGERWYPGRCLPAPWACSVRRRAPPPAPR